MEFVLFDCSGILQGTLCVNRERERPLLANLLSTASRVRRPIISNGRILVYDGLIGAWKS
jgi:hypothetical protein